MSEAAELDRLQRISFDYFLHETNPVNGLVSDKTAPNWPASIAAVGMALASYPVGVERGYISRAAAAKRVLTTLRFFFNSVQSNESDATGYHGFYYHFLDMQSGRRFWNCELSTVDTAFLLAGALAAGQYFDEGNAHEQEIRELAEALYLRADWRWAQHGNTTLSHGWTPEHGFLPYRWDGYDEALLLYVLALGSPTHPLPEPSYAAWTKGYQWVEHYGHQYLYAGPLFTHQLSHIWIDFRNIRDDFMRSRNCDYFENSRRATYVQKAYAMANPHGYAEYGEHCWGITASDGPGPVTMMVNGVERTFFDYIARGAPYGPDDGTLAPWGMAASLPFAPEIVLPAIDYAVHHLKLTEANRYGFKATYNPTFPEKSHAHGWVSPWHYGLNEGPVVLMLENHLSGLLWRLMQQCPHVKRGLQRAGFDGGWLGTNTLRPASGTIKEQITK